LDFPGIAFARPDEASAKGLGEVARMSAEITLDKLGDRMSAADRETFTAAMGLVTPWLVSLNCADRSRKTLSTSTTGPCLVTASPTMIAKPAGGITDSACRKLC
jgi:hypothetical protein